MTTIKKWAMKRLKQVSSKKIVRFFDVENNELKI